MLAGEWVLVDPASGAARAGGRLNKSIVVGRDAGGDAIAAAMSRNLLAASEAIAREIAAIGTPPEDRAAAAEDKPRDSEFGQRCWGNAPVSQKRDPYSFGPTPVWQPKRAARGEASVPAMAGT